MVVLASTGSPPPARTGAARFQQDGSHRTNQSVSSTPPVSSGLYLSVAHAAPASLSSVRWELRGLPSQPDRQLIDGLEPKPVVQRFARRRGDQIEGLSSAFHVVPHGRE